MVNKKPQVVNMVIATEAEKGYAKAYQDEDLLFKIGSQQRIHKSNRRFFNKKRNNSFKYNDN